MAVASAVRSFNGIRRELLDWTVTYEAVEHRPAHVKYRPMSARMRGDVVTARGNCRSNPSPLTLRVRATFTDDRKIPCDAAIDRTG